VKISEGLEHLSLFRALVSPTGPTREPLKGEKSLLPPWGRSHLNHRFVFSFPPPSPSEGFPPRPVPFSPPPLLKRAHAFWSTRKDSILGPKSLFFPLPSTSLTAPILLRYRLRVVHPSWSSKASPTFSQLSPPYCLVSVDPIFLLEKQKGRVRPQVDILLPPISVSFPHPTVIPFPSGNLILQPPFFPSSRSRRSLPKNGKVFNSLHEDFPLCNPP